MSSTTLHPNSIRFSTLLAEPNTAAKSELLNLYKSAQAQASLDAIRAHIELLSQDPYPTIICPMLPGELQMRDADGKLTDAPPCWQELHPISPAAFKFLERVASLAERGVNMINNLTNIESELSLPGTPESLDQFASRCLAIVNNCQLKCPPPMFVDGDRIMTLEASSLNAYFGSHEDLLSTAFEEAKEAIGNNVTYENNEALDQTVKLQKIFEAYKENLLMVKSLKENDLTLAHLTPVTRITIERHMKVVALSSFERLNQLDPSELKPIPQSLVRRQREFEAKLIEEHPKLEGQKSQFPDIDGLLTIKGWGEESKRKNDSSNETSETWE